MASPKLRAFRGRAIYRTLLLIGAIVRMLPLKAARTIGRALGHVAWHLVRRERRKALRNIAMAFPAWSNAQCRRTIHAMFLHLGASLAEILWMPRLDVAKRDALNIVTGMDDVLKVIDDGDGVITFTAHCGNWEWLCYSMGMYGRPVSVLQRERDEPEMNRFITDLRAKSGVRTIDRGSPSSARDMITVVRKGGMLAFVLDQNIRTESVKVPFFGIPAPTPIGPTRFAIRSEAWVTIALAERRADGKQILKFSEPFRCTRDDDPIALTTRITGAIEEQIRRAPEQWVWFHDRWRERPRWDVTPF
ncbi:MAG TPA: lysophospholipid acyltransferase family protein [Thermoanaerobaculia bacterium]